MGGYITRQELLDASRDAQDYEVVVNGGEDAFTVNRAGNVLPSVLNFFKQMMQLVNDRWPGRSYATLAEMQADTSQAVGTSGRVESDPGDVDGNINGNYYWSGTEWIRSDVQPPSIAQLDALEAQVSSLGLTIISDPFTGSDGIRYVYGLVDQAGYLVCGADMNGRFVVGGILVELLAGRDAKAAWGVADADGRMALAVGHQGEVIFGGVSAETPSPSEVSMPFSVADQLGRVALYIDRQGTVHIPALAADSSNPDQPSTLAVLRNQRTDYMHIVSYGQSLSRGATSGPTAITTTQPYNNVTFLSGVLGRPPFATDYSGFKPLVEAYLEVTQNEAESPTSTIANGLVTSRVAAGDEAEDWVFVGTAPGQGGQSISDLSKGTVRWERMIDQFRAALLLAASESKSYSVWGMAWTQGENNYAVNPVTGVDWTADEYRDLFRKLVLDLGEDSQAVTGQDFQPPVSTYQTCAHRRYGRDHNNVAIGQWLAARDDASISMACPIYQIPHNTDNLHLTGDSYIQLGKYHERALAKMVFEREKFIPTWPTAVLWQGKVIDITFHVPVGELVFDTTIVAAAPNMGFDIWSGTAQVSGAISSVNIIGRDRVRIVLAEEPPLDALLTYARGRVGDPATGGPINGPRGNLRDTAGDTDNYQDSQGVTRYLHNWCVMFEYSYAKGAF